MKPLNFATTFSAGLLLLALSPPALAQSIDDECSSDADCPDDYICESVEWGACPACEPGQECGPCETGTASFCTPPPPKQCASDASCDGSDVCVTYTFETCSGELTRPLCDPDDATCVDDDGSDDPAPEPECETSTESYCVPPYLAPCSADADCGAGFTCEAAEVCSCSGGGSTEPLPPGEDGDTEPDRPIEEDCSCEPSDHTYCQLIEVVCDTDADCAGDLVCQDIYDGGPAPAIDCAEPDDGTDCLMPDPGEAVSYCAPTDYGYYGGGSYSESVARATGHDDATVTQTERQEFFPVDGTDDSDSKEEPSSCSTATSGSGGSLLLLLGGLLIGRRRRRA